MPLPVGHSLMGYTIYETLLQENRGLSWKMLLLFVVVANLPDIDFLPGFFVGNPNKYHHHLTHSLSFSVMVGLILASSFYFIKKQRFLPDFLIFTVVSFSHVVLDFFTADSSRPYGMPIFWPFSSAHFISPVPIFMSVHKVGSGELFIQSLFITHNFWVALWEIIIFIPILTIIKIKKKRQKWLPTFANE